MAKRKSNIASAHICSGVLTTLNEKVYESNLSKALYYAHYNLSAKELAKELTTYAKTQTAYKKAPLTSLPDYEAVTVGKYCFILNNGGTLTEEASTQIHEMIDVLVQKAITIRDSKKEDIEERELVKGPVLTIQDRLRLKANSVCGEGFEGVIDELITNPKAFDFAKFDPVSIIGLNDLKSGHLRYVIKDYEPRIAEIEEYLSGKCEELNESYEYLGKAAAKKLIKLMQSIIDVSHMYITKGKANQKPKAKKIVPANKVVEKLKYLPGDTALKLASINPIDILSAKELWIYNTKNRKVGVYRAMDERGLYVKGASIINIAETSTQKTLRKPAEQLRTFKGTMTKFKKAYADINSMETKLTGRLNENCILLKVIK